MQKSYIKRFESFNKSFENLSKAKNDLTHDYDFELAKEKYERIINSYIPVFESFENKINRYID